MVSMADAIPYPFKRMPASRLAQALFDPDPPMDRPPTLPLADGHDDSQATVDYGNEEGEVAPPHEEKEDGKHDEAEGYHAYQIWETYSWGDADWYPQSAGDSSRGNTGIK